MKTRLTLSALLVIAACNRAQSGTEGSRVLDLEISGEKSLAAVTDVTSARRQASALGYLDDKRCAGGLRGGEQVMFATGDDLISEIGQASGVLVAKDGGLFFEQRAEHAELLAPGLKNRASKDLPAMSTWEFREYFSLVCTVLFQLDDTHTAAKYDVASASLVSAKGGTAGIEASFDNLLRVAFNGKTPSGGKATTTLYLKKDFGIVGLEYQEAEGYAPQAKTVTQSGSFRLYLDFVGGTGIGSGPSKSKLLEAREKACKGDGSLNSYFERRVGEVNEYACWREVKGATGENCFDGDSKPRMYSEPTCYELFDLPE